MMAILSLALKSLWNRRATVLLTLLSIALSVTLLLGVERVRNDAKQAFANTVCETAHKMDLSHESLPPKVTLAIGQPHSFFGS